MHLCGTGLFALNICIHVHDACEVPVNALCDMHKYAWVNCVAVMCMPVICMCIYVYDAYMFVCMCCVTCNVCMGV